ncbi:MAG: hypothetical protein A3K19_12830 [Lentisphaerae bacterium RIFOXYB12_FULL_65_16]|nr:MAG: hypothetical protein A3K18_13575 [Lentisphaerae bacterium RIFOXYA12_64_32]OGV87197.1 MAG: hypothetical protein A3K19_12830 [Lentisphaerae bacterium RIFOXYB12_FULL_65_16]
MATGKMPTAEEKDKCVTALTRISELLGLNAEVSAREDEHGLTLVMNAPEPGRLIGRKGQYLQSMELLLNRLARKQCGPIGWVEVDVDGYQKARRESVHERSGGGAAVAHLRQVALDAAKEVKRWGTPREIGPFSARDRRVVHMALRDDPEIQTESESEIGDGKGLKKVVVRAAGKGSPAPAEQ